MLRLVLMMALAIASSFALTQLQDQKKDRVGNLVSTGVEYLKSTLAKEDPTIIPDSSSRDVSAAVAFGLIPINATNSMNMTNLKYSGVSKVKADLMKIDPEHLTAQLLLTFPEIKFAGDYQLNGEMVGKKAKGEGGFELKALNVTYYVGNLQLLETEGKALRIKSLGLDYDISDISLVTNGLTVENTTVAEFENYVSQFILARMKSDKASYNRGYERAFMNTWNKKIGNRTLEEFTQWMKENTNPSQLIFS